MREINMQEKVCIIEDDTFSYVCLNRFTNWDDFEKLIDVMEKVPGVSFKGELLEGPYSKYIDFWYESTQLTLMYHNEIGNCIRISKRANDDQRTQIVLKLCQEIDMIAH
jgi:hypothetical protein